MGTTPLPIELSVRLADEGVPLRAIARAIGTPSDVVREELVAARQEGRLLELPRDDWPPGFPRDQRALQLSRLVTENREALILGVQKSFRLTATQATLLLALVQHPQVAKSRMPLGISVRCADVHICTLRRLLAPLGVHIETIWGYGFQLAPADRRRVMDMVLGEIVEVQESAA
jgi:hypothetical protein